MYTFKMRDTSWHDCLSWWVKIWPAQTCDIDSLLIVILMWSERACMWTPPLPKHPGTCNNKGTCCGWHVKTYILYWELTVCFSWAAGHTKGPLAANQYLRLHQHRAGQLWGRAFYSKSLMVVWVCVCMLCVCVFICIVHVWYECVCMCLFARARECLCLMSLITGHRPDSHQVLSWLVISSAPHRQISYL